jgi:penicillin-binding protein 1A
MGKLDNIRSNQNQRQKKTKGRAKSKNLRSPALRGFVMALKVGVITVFLSAAILMIWAYAQVDFTFGDNLGTFDMKLSSTIYVKDDGGEYYAYEQFKSADNRIWVDIDKVPKYMQDAFVAIEDQRFYSHMGVDIKRTFGAVLNVFLKGDSSYGGSTITQQLVKNITQDKERTNARKIREISRAIVLETKLSKSQILELYMNSIYLSQGVHGVQAASYLYFGKSVDQLSLAQCASIAGITQYPTTYDPILNPENNKKKQLLILDKMLELEYISQEEYDKAIKEDLDFSHGKSGDLKENQGKAQSYFADHIFEEAKKDLMKEFEYSEQYAENLLYNGGLKIYATMDPNIQKTAESYYENDKNFPAASGGNVLQSAIIVTDHNSGKLRAIVGGRGKKTNNRVLNRATQSKRQPGSTIKPIAVYAPALEENVINLTTYIDNAPIKIGEWEPQNANGKFSGPVPVKTAVAWSYNMPAIRTLQAVGIDVAFEYLKDKMHISSLVEKGTYSDKNPSLALGGVTHGITPLEMSTAYSCIANGGMYIEPISYTKICTKDGELVFENKPKKNRVFSEETAFLMQELLKNVVNYGTAGGNKISGMDTCGKTGTTDDNKDKWFIGFTPYYCSTVWVGYDKPRVIGAGTELAVGIWRKVMTEIHKDLKSDSFDKPDGIIKANICPHTGKYASDGCGATDWANKKFLTGYCRGKHPKTLLISDTPYVDPEEEKENEENTEGENAEGENTGGENTGGETGTHETGNTNTGSTNEAPASQTPAA